MHSGFENDSTHWQMLQNRENIYTSRIKLMFRCKQSWCSFGWCERNLYPDRISLYNNDIFALLSIFCKFTPELRDPAQRQRYTMLYADTLRWLIHSDENLWILFVYSNISPAWHVSSRRKMSSSMRIFLPMSVSWQGINKKDQIS